MIDQLPRGKPAAKPHTIRMARRSVPRRCLARRRKTRFAAAVPTPARVQTDTHMNEPSKERAQLVPARRQQRHARPACCASVSRAVSSTAGDAESRSSAGRGSAPTSDMRKLFYFVLVIILFLFIVSYVGGAPAIKWVRELGADRPQGETGMLGCLKIAQFGKIRQRLLETVANTETHRNETQLRTLLTNSCHPHSPLRPFQLLFVCHSRQ